MCRVERWALTYGLLSTAGAWRSGARTSPQAARRCSSRAGSLVRATHQTLGPAHPGHRWGTDVEPSGGIVESPPPCSRSDEEPIRSAGPFSSPWCGRCAACLSATPPLDSDRAQMSKLYVGFHLHERARRLSSLSSGSGRGTGRNRGELVEPPRFLHLARSDEPTARGGDLLGG
jgi:hypothetical protein